MAALFEKLQQPGVLSVLVFLAGYIYICAAKRFRATVLWAGVALLLLLGTYRPDVIVDNLGAGFSTTGSWDEADATNEHGGSSLQSKTVGSTATWAPTLPGSGRYDVYAWWSAGASNGGYDVRDAQAKYTVTYADHAQDVRTVDQSLNTGRWFLLGTYEFDADGNENVTLIHGQDHSPTSADAVRFAPSAARAVGMRALLASVGHLLRHINWNVLMILAGAMTVAELFIRSRVPVLLADVIVRHLKTVGGAALGVCAMSSFLSAFIDNVTTVLIVAPVAVELARRLRTSPVPFVIGLAIASNLQGTATLIGDPPSLILANGLGLDFLDFFVFRGKPGIFWAVQLGAVGSMLALWVLFFRKYKEPAAPPEVVRPTSWFPTALLGGMVVALCIASQVSERVPHGDRFLNGSICVAAALVGVLWHARHGTGRALKTLLQIDFATVALLAAIFALTFALSKTGVIAELADRVQRAVGTNTFLTFTLIVWMSVGFSAVIDNIPYTAVMLPTVLGIATHMTGVADEFTSTHVLFGFGLLVGACLGGNISPVGASANIVGVGLLRKRGHDVGFWQFVGMGLPFTIAATVPAYLFLWWLWG